MLKFEPTLIVYFRPLLISGLLINTGENALETLDLRLFYQKSNHAAVVQPFMERLPLGKQRRVAAKSIVAHKLYANEPKGGTVPPFSFPLSSPIIRLRWRRHLDHAETTTVPVLFKWIRCPDQMLASTVIVISTDNLPLRLLDPRVFPHYRLPRFPLSSFVDLGLVSYRRF